MAAQGRGGRHPVAALPLAVKPSALQETVPGLRPFRAARAAHEDTESESDDESVASSSSSSSDDCASDGEAEKGEEAAKTAKVVQGVFLLNYLSLCFHAAVLLKDGSYGRACAPRRAVPEPNRQVLTEHPLAGKRTVFHAPILLAPQPRQLCECESWGANARLPSELWLVCSITCGFGLSIALEAWALVCA